MLLGVDIHTGRPVTDDIPEPILDCLHLAFNHRINMQAVEMMEKWDIQTHEFGGGHSTEMRVQKVYTCTASPAPGAPPLAQSWDMAVTYYSGTYQYQYTHHQWSAEGYCWVPTIAGFVARTGQRPLGRLTDALPTFAPGRRR